MKHFSLLMVLIVVVAMLVMAGCPKPQDAGNSEVDPAQTAVSVDGDPADLTDTIDAPADAPADTTDTPADTTDTDEEASSGMTTTDSGLQFEDLVVGDGDEAVEGKKVAMHYTGWLEDGTKFDSSHDRGKPFPFTLGVGEVIPGWDEGVQGMKVGGKRKFIIPSDLGYGPAGSPPVIPANATLIFEVELLEVE